MAQNDDFQNFGTITNRYKVRLEEATAYPESRAGSRNPRLTRVIFDVTPDLVESGTVEYKTMQPVHMPGQIFVYGSSNSRTFQLSNVRLISRTVDEATKNMEILWTLRGWRMPYFGDSSTLGANNITARNNIASIRRAARNGNLTPSQQRRIDLQKKSIGQELLGKPPQVLKISAYSNPGDITVEGARRTRSHPTHINNIPVVITSLTIPYPSDVDYIPTKDNQPMPRIMALDIALTETQAPRQLEQFRLQDYRRGILDGF